MIDRPKMFTLEEWADRFLAPSLCRQFNIIPEELDRLVEQWKTEVKEEADGPKTPIR